MKLMVTIKQLEFTVWEIPKRFNRAKPKFLKRN